jgi:hypothetical protein
MALFVRFDRGDYEKLADRDRWSAGEAANLFVNTKKDIDGSFLGHCWRDDAEKACVALLSDEFMKWCRDGRIVPYGEAGNLGHESPLVS